MGCEGSPSLTSAWGAAGGSRARWWDTGAEKWVKGLAAAASWAQALQYRVSDTSSPAFVLG